MLQIFNRVFKKNTDCLQQLHKKKLWEIPWILLPETSLCWRSCCSKKLLPLASLTPSKSLDLLWYHYWKFSGKFQNKITEQRVILCFCHRIKNVFVGDEEQNFTHQNKLVFLNQTYLLQKKKNLPLNRGITQLLLQKNLPLNRGISPALRQMQFHKQQKSLPLNRGISPRTSSSIQTNKNYSVSSGNFYTVVYKNFFTLLTFTTMWKTFHFTEQQKTYPSRCCVFLCITFHS